MALDEPRATHRRDEPASPRQDPDAATLVGNERLPCGRLVSHIWQQVRAPIDQNDPHTADCVFCRQVIEGLTALDNATATLRAEHPGADSVARRVMRAVRAEVRLGRLLPLDDPAQELRIAETAAAKVLRGAADRVCGVRAASCRLSPDDGSREVTVTMTLAMTLDQPLIGRAAAVRRAVAYSAAQGLGIAISAIDLRIVSVLAPLTPTVSAEASERKRSGL
ncbi:MULTISPECIES: hypothetical protein [unclassified Streptomyces]|uniref:hypothetical protein n=1 Tax=unclassified Streptomyces TaxID=2593676 RepID=UPI00081F2107|nr:MULTISPECIES: hypothetical protein [unclassified Streptomyces]MYZ36329.1 hypothetical protein [Streptomyces sp. SID4917]SCF82723.1 hypothetical protein GA0115259_103239 [Streptomyces sp. MnatMP-M17]